MEHNLRETETKTGFLQQNTAYRNGCGQQVTIFDKCHRWTEGQLTYPGFEKQVYNQVPTAVVSMFHTNTEIQRGKLLRVCRNKQAMNKKKALMLVGADEKEVA